MAYPRGLLAASLYSPARRYPAPLRPLGEGAYLLEPSEQPSATTPTEASVPSAVVMFQRKPLSGQRSVERVFAHVRTALPEDIYVTTRVLPFESRGVVNRMRNLLFAWRHRGSINHITGDVQYLALGLPGKSTILTVLDLVSVERLAGLRRRLLVLFWYQLPAWRARCITTISASTRRQLVSLVPTAAGKTVVIYCPVLPTFRLTPPPRRDRPVLLQVGTGPHKNLFRVIDAVSDLDAHLRIIGTLDGPQLEHLAASGVDYSQTDELSDDQMLDEYRNCDIVVFVSTYEGFGLPIIEAQASGRPVVTSSVASMPEVAGDGALIVDPFDVPAICRAITALIHDDSLYQSTVARGYTNSERFTVSSIARSYAEIYRSLH